MGCDIHMHVEKKVGDRWEHFREVDVGRDYQLFGFLVDGHPRSCEEGLFPQRGLPADINPLTKELLTTFADHTYSWITYKEAQELREMYDQNIDFLNDRYYFYLTPEDIEEMDHQFRFVFGFDN